MTTATMWVCIDCMLMHANGECDPDRPEDLPEPWALMEGDPGEVTMGLLTDECGHDLDDEQARDAHAEECERMSFSWSRCEGCGSTLEGERHAFTYWTKEEKS